MDKLIDKRRFCAEHFSCNGCPWEKCPTTSNAPRTAAILMQAAEAIEKHIKEEH